MPIVSVIMGVYYKNNDLFFLKRSVESILAQSMTDLEFVICDDGSTAAVCQYLEEMKHKDSRIRIVRTGELFSLPEKLNACLSQSTGKLIARMDDDDYSHIDRFTRQISFMQQHPEVAFVGCQANLWRKGMVIDVRHFPLLPSVKDFYFSQPFLHPSLMFRREPLELVGGYSTDRYCLLCEDYDLLLRLYALGYQGANLPQVLIDYTVPLKVKGARNMRHRLNEVVTRYRRFKELKQFPYALPYVIKPILVGVLPDSILLKLKKRKLNKEKNRINY